MSVSINTVNFYGNTIINNVVGAQVVTNYYTKPSSVTKLLFRTILNRHDCIKMLLEELEFEQLSEQTQTLLAKVKGYMDDTDSDIKKIGEYISL